MPKLATWIRDVDEANFQRFFDREPGLEIFNARRDAAFEVTEMDGLLLTGGPDISAQFLRQEVPDAALIEEAEPERDAWEFAAVRTALEREKPIFAICKGHQVLNVALGGTLHLDIPGHRGPELKYQNVQPLRYAAQAPPPRFDFVNSSHHQAIDRLGDGLEIEAWSTADEIVEQVRLRHHPYCLGVQYHPERDSIYIPLFATFFEQLRS